MTSNKLEQEFAELLERSEYTWKELGLLDMEAIAEELPTAKHRPLGWKVWTH